MPSLREPKTVTLWAWFSPLYAPVAPKLTQTIGAQPTQQNIIRRSILRVQFETISFKPLGEIAFACIRVDLVVSIRDRISICGQTAVVLPELKEASGERMAGFWKGARVGG